MLGNARELRLHAEHCRRKARSVSDERIRSILQTMATELDQQADVEDVRSAG